jgi:hypothetical protein
VRASAPGPHAISAVSGTKNAGYCYDDWSSSRSAASRDARGNLLAGDGRSVTWSAFDMVTSVSRAGSTAAFDYGPDRQRFRRIDATPQGQVTTTLYVGGKAMEVVFRPGGVIETKVYIGDILVPCRAKRPSSPLGSVHVVVGGEHGGAAGIPAPRPPGLGRYRH